MLTLQILLLSHKPSQRTGPPFREHLQPLQVKLGDIYVRQRFCFFLDIVNVVVWYEQLLQIVKKVIETAIHSS